MGRAEPAVRQLKMGTYDVIIPLFNGEKWIDEAIRSVLDQRVQPQRILVVNDGSTDSSVERVTRLPQVELFHNPNPGSAARAKNYGLQQSTAPLIAFLDQDDVWHPRHIELLREALLDYPDIPAAASFFKYFRDNSQPPFDLTDGKIERIDPWDFYPFAQFMEPSVILFRRWAFDRLSWSDRVPGFADRYLWLQLSVHSPLVRLHVKSVAKRIHADCQYRSMFRDPVANLGDWAKVSEALFSYRAEHVKETAQSHRLQNRRLIVPCLRDILQSLVEDNNDANKSLLSSHARTLETILQDDKSLIQKQTFEVLCHFIDGIQETIYREREPMEVYERMYQAWPEDCPVSRRLVVARILRYRPGLKFYLRQVLHDPFHSRPYALVSNAMRYRWNGVGGAGASGVAAIWDKSRRGDGKDVRFISAWGERGLEPNQFLHCEFLCLDAHGRLLVSDAEQAVVKVFSVEGELITQIGGRGEGKHQFVEPEGVAVDRDGYVFVSDSTTGWIKKFDTNYIHRLTFGGHGREKGKIKHSEGMTISPEGILYVADANNQRISAFDLAGEPLFTFGTMGSGPGQFNGPQSCTVDSQGDIWVTDFFNHRIQVFTCQGEFLQAFGGEGRGPQEFNCPTGLAVDRADRVYVCDMGNHRIQVLDRHGNFQYMFGRKGRRAGEFDTILDVVVNDKGDLFVADCGNHRIQRFRIKNF